MANHIVLLIAFIAKLMPGTEVKPGDGTWLGQQVQNYQRGVELRWKIENLENRVVLEPGLLLEAPPADAMELAQACEISYHRTLLDACRSRSDLSELEYMAESSNGPKEEIAATLRRARAEVEDCVRIAKLKRKVVKWLMGAEKLVAAEKEWMAGCTCDVAALLKEF